MGHCDSPSDNNSTSLGRRIIPAFLGASSGLCLGISLVSEKNGLRSVILLLQAAFWELFLKIANNQKPLKVLMIPFLLPLLRHCTLSKRKKRHFSRRPFIYSHCNFCKNIEEERITLVRGVAPAKVAIFKLAMLIKKIVEPEDSLSLPALPLFKGLFSPLNNGGDERKLRHTLKPAICLVISNELGFLVSPECLTFKFPRQLS